MSFISSVQLSTITYNVPVGIDRLSKSSANKKEKCAFTNNIYVYVTSYSVKSDCDVDVKVSIIHS